MGEDLKLQTRSIGSSGLKVTPIGFGASALGSMPDTYGYRVSEEQAHETIRAVLDGPVNFLDTSRNYGLGRSERRIGEAIRERGGLPDGFVLATKLDRDMDSNRFDAAQARRSLEESLAALGVDRVPLLHLHDPEHAADLSEAVGPGGAIDELFRMREEGLATAVGIAMGRIDIQLPLIRDHPFDALVSHNRYTLLNRQADALFDLAAERGIAVLNAAPYAGGVLAKGSATMPRITYQPADAEGLAPVRAIESVSAEHGIAPGAAALQFSLRDPRVTSTIVGVASPERIAETLAWADAPIPDTAWAALAALPFDADDPEANRRYTPG